MSVQHASNALALIDHVNAGTGAYTDANIAAVAGVKTWLRQVASGQLITVEPPKVEPPKEPER